ncbi:hypothetical protein SAMN06265173_1502 [Thalassovita litoralis]|jgi:hypothetical protein|uniref:Integral membrane protein n=1 Tax=Thalassovita litoralis TaxID=1010611 RepID=A0A521FSG1_9RHOB|nr:hypothetical protein [Thalassovita litoralis]SMO99167.1 hypothetical protein SAMN06265173_1502 [Thalassovita litoralis]
MKNFKLMSAACLLALAASPALANGPRIYPYPASANYCPAGLQPITIDGVICCGTPNQSMTYQQAKAAPGPRTYRPARRSGMVCPEGEKGCYQR